MHLNLARCKGRCSNRRNPSSDFGGGVNATLELLPHVGHPLSLTITLQQQSRIWGHGRSQPIHRLTDLVGCVSGSGELGDRLCPSAEFIGPLKGHRPL